MTTSKLTWSVGHEDGRGIFDINGTKYTCTRTEAHRLAQSLLTLGNNMLKLEERQPVKLSLRKRLYGYYQAIGRIRKAKNDDAGRDRGSRNEIGVAQG